MKAHEGGAVVSSSRVCTFLSSDKHIQKGPAAEQQVLLLQMERKTRFELATPQRVVPTAELFPLSRLILVRPVLKVAASAKDCGAPGRFEPTPPDS